MKTVLKYQKLRKGEATKKVHEKVKEGRKWKQTIKNIK